MICALTAVFLGGSSKLGHGDHNHLVPLVLQVTREGLEAQGDLRQHERVAAGAPAAAACYPVAP